MAHNLQVLSYTDKWQVAVNGYQALVHDSAKSALADAFMPGTQVFILDIGLPRMDG